MSQSKFFGKLDTLVSESSHLGRFLEHNFEIQNYPARTTTGLRDSQWVDRIDTRRWIYADDSFPLQTVVPVKRAPTQQPDLSQGINRRDASGLLQTEQVFLKNWVFQVKTNGDVYRAHSPYPCCSTAARTVLIWE